MRKALFVLSGGFTGLTLIMGVMLMSVRVSAEEEVISNVSVSVPAGCGLRTDATTDVAHTSTVTAGTYQAEIGTTTFRVFCNDSGGFSVYAVGYSNEEMGNTKLLATVGGTLAPSFDINTGLATNGSISNWAMKLTPVAGAYAPTILSAPNVTGGTDESFASYHAVPGEFTKVATYNSTTDITNGSAFTSTYAVYVAGTQPAGMYNGKVKYTMVYPASEVPLSPVVTMAGKIGYVPNATGVVDTMGDQSASANSEVTLWASNFQRPGYGFAGWSTTFDYSDPNGFYGPNETITTPSDLATKGLTLYAIWVKSAGDIQNWQGCNSLTQGQVTALTDTRDNNVYAVAKLADGNCWMIENLRLDNTNSDNTTGALSQGYNTATFKGLADPESANFSTSTTAANSLYSTNGANNTFAITGSNQAYRFPRYNNVNTKTPVANMTGTNAEIYSYGNYYTWSVAIADTTNYTTNNQSVTTTSLCPAGWHLPKGGDKSNESNNEFWNLIVTELNNGTNPANYSSSTRPYYTGTPEGSDVSKLVRKYPNNFLYSGDYGNSSARLRGSYGYYWSSTASLSYDAYLLYFYGTGVYPGTYNLGKGYGRSIRCAAN